jgi:putative peptide zinc metalloprotease protein
MTRDYGIRDLGRIVLTLRKDLTFTPQDVDGKAGYLIEDPVKTKFHRVGIAEYQFMSLLDGKTSISDALHTTAATLSDQAFTQTEAAAICKWLVDSGLAHTQESSQSGRLLASAHESERASLLRQLNPMYIRVPLVQPDRFLDALAPSLGWIHGPIGWALASVLAVVASSQLLIHWDRFAATTDTILSPNRWLWLALCWIVLKVIHETSHGLVCKRYGGSVREFGVIFVLFAPLAFVDVTSSWRFSSKWHRIHTALAGMYIEFLCASVAAIVWSQTGPGPLNDAAFNLIVMASITTVVFNANPLMRFDGYYVLSDFLELPNLYSNGQQFVNYLGRRYLVGIVTQRPRWTAGKDTSFSTMR